MVLASDDAQALKATAQALERELRGRSAICGDVTSTASLERPEIVVRPNAQRAAERGVTTAGRSATTVRVATSGDFDAQLAKLNLDSRQIDIRVQLRRRVARADLETIANLRVPGRDGPVPLVERRELVGRERAVADRPLRPPAAMSPSTPTSAGYPLGDALAAASELPAMVGLPSSVELIELGDAELMAELFAGFGFAMLTGVLCVLCVLVLLFKDFLQPVTILSALPLSIGGALLALLIAGGEPRPAVADRPRDADGHRHEELDPARRVRVHRHARARHCRCTTRWSTPATNARGRS